MSQAIWTQVTPCHTASEFIRAMIANVVLDADTVTSNMAARLSTCSLGHVLFLKNQVPLSDFHLFVSHRGDLKSDPLIQSRRAARTYAKK